MKNKVAIQYRKFLDMLNELRRKIGEDPEEIFKIAKIHYGPIYGLGPNVATEILNTYLPEKYPILNNNPLSSLIRLGLTSFPNQQSFQADTYGQYANLMTEIRKMCKFKDLAQVDHFMNFIYQKYIKAKNRVNRKK